MAKKVHKKKTLTHEQVIDNDITLAKRDADFKNAADPHDIPQAHQRGAGVKTAKDTSGKD